MSSFRGKRNLDWKNKRNDYFGDKKKKVFLNFFLKDWILKK